MAERIEVSLAGLQVAGKLQEAHAAFIGLVGKDGLAEIVEEWRPLFDAARQELGGTVLETAAVFLKALRKRDPYGSGPQEVQLLAVTVELMGGR